MEQARMDQINQINPFLHYIAEYDDNIIFIDWYFLQSKVVDDVM
jgi:hypothetical protein